MFSFQPQTPPNKPKSKNMKERRESSPLQVNGFLHTGATFPNKMPRTSRCHRPKLGEHVSVGFRKPLAQARAPMTTTPVPSIKDGNVTPFPTEVYSINTSHTQHEHGPHKTATPTTHKHMKQHVPPFPTTPESVTGDLATATLTGAFTTLDIQPTPRRPETTGAG